LNDLNHYLVLFPVENPKQLDQDEIIEILDQTKTMDPEWHEAMVNANIDNFEISCEESVSCFDLENLKLEKSRHINGPNPSSLSVDNKKSVLVSVTSSLGNPFISDKNKHNTVDCRAIDKLKQQKYAHFEAKAGPS
jgi:hypothetical protein